LYNINQCLLVYFEDPIKEQHQTRNRESKFVCQPPKDWIEKW